MSDRNTRLYEGVTNDILAALAAGTPPWRKSWASAGEQLRSTNQPYRGINQFLLGLRAMSRGYSSPFWLTFKQALDLGGHVRKGEKSTMVCFFKTVVKGEGEDEARFRVLKSYSVFNAGQCEGLPARFFPAARVYNQDQPYPGIEAALLERGPKILPGEPAYWPALDHVTMPAFESFTGSGAYYATLAHELVHWTKPKHRVDRQCGSYALEELVAEIGACFACARLGIEGEHIDNHAAYIASWSKAIKDDPHAIFKAAAMAQEAVDYLLGAVAEEEEA